MHATAFSTKFFQGGEDVTKRPSTWNVYRTRFLIRARQLDRSFSFVDSLGREQRGKKGDYLVESYEGALSITPRRIFEDIYVVLEGSQPDGALQDQAPPQCGKVVALSPQPRFSGVGKKRATSCGKGAASPASQPLIA